MGKCWLLVSGDNTLQERALGKVVEFVSDLVRLVLAGCFESHGQVKGILAKGTLLGHRLIVVGASGLIVLGEVLMRNRLLRKV